MALIAKATGEQEMPLDTGHHGYGGSLRRVPFKRYKIIDRYKGRDTVVGSAWGKNAQAALKEYRAERQGKTD